MYSCWNIYFPLWAKMPHAIQSHSLLYFCNWRCYNEINSVAITDFTSCYQFALERAATRGRLKIFLFHASSISSLYERWASGCICCFSFNVTWQESILPVTQCFLPTLWFHFCRPGKSNFIPHSDASHDKTWNQMERPWQRIENWKLTFACALSSHCFNLA